MKNKAAPICRLQYAVLLIAMLVPSLQAHSQVSHLVTASNYTFNPSELTIAAGDTVIWQNTSGTHNVDGNQETFPSNPESFGNDVGSGWTYKHVFDKSGTYNYQCDPHANLGMTGKVIVEDNPSGDAKITLHFTNMTPHIGQEFTVFLKDAGTKEYLDTVKLSEIGSATFDITFNDVGTGKSYEVDFYADLNGNKAYDAPPVDHAWRLTVNDVQGDVSLDFAHNTNFTDIFAVATGLENTEGSNDLVLYPNPAVDHAWVFLSNEMQGTVLLNVYNSSGTLLDQMVIPAGQNAFLLDISHYSQGMYLVECVNGERKALVSLIKQ